MVRATFNFRYSWIVITVLTYLGVGAFQFHVVFPLEAELLPRFSQYASLMFLPHAVRVLATVILGPKAFIALIVSVIISQHIYYISSYNSLTLSQVIYPFIAAACAPVAYVLVKWVLHFRVDHKKALLNWRYVFLIGIVASAINSVGLALFLFDLSSVPLIAGVILRFFVGDLIGLITGLLILAYIFRLLREYRSV